MIPQTRQTLYFIQSCEKTVLASSKEFEGVVTEVSLGNLLVVGRDQPHSTEDGVLDPTRELDGIKEEVSFQKSKGRHPLNPTLAWGSNPSSSSSRLRPKNLRFLEPPLPTSSPSSSTIPMLLSWATRSFS